MKNHVYAILLGLVFCSCRSTNLVYISVLEPAPVTIPSNIKTVAVVNRTEVASQNKAIDVVDKVFSLEGVHLDKEATRAGMNGLSDELRRNNRFTDVKLLNQVALTSPVPGIFPAPLPWETIEKICIENNTDALFSIELFDTDSKISYSAKTVSLKTPLGNVPAIEHQADMQTLVKMGWRIYDPSQRIVLDEYAVSRRMHFYGSGINPAAAAAAIINRKQAVVEAAEKSGHTYALRILPYWIRVNREYFVRGTENFKIARRKAQTGNWNGAAALWKTETNHPNANIAGRACYNMAIISEINGDLDAAIQWAKKSYEDYKIRLALDYIRMLERRKADNAVLKEQEPDQG